MRNLGQIQIGCPLAVSLVLLLMHVSASAASDQFTEVVAPLLSSKCLSCHNDEKNEGDLSLVDPQQLIDDGVVNPQTCLSKPPVGSCDSTRRASGDAQRRRPFEAPIRSRRSNGGLNRARRYRAAIVSKLNRLPISIGGLCSRSGRRESLSIVRPSIAQLKQDCARTACHLCPRHRLKS